MPEVLIWITCRNYERYIEQAVNAAIAQTVPCTVNVIHDGCSAVFRDEESRKPHGVARSRNLVSPEGEERYVIFLDADDLIPADYVEQLLMVAAGDNVVVACGAQLFGDENRVVDVREPVNMETLLEGNTVHCAALVPSKTFREVGGFDPALSSHEDWDLWCRLAARGVEFRVCDSTRLFYRRHECSRSRQNPGGFEIMKKELNERYAAQKVV